MNRQCREIIVDKPSPRDIGRFIPGFSYSQKTQFKHGEHKSPSTEFKIGERKSPKTEFKPGQSAHNKLPIGSETIRTYKGKKRAWIKIHEPNEWKLKAVYVYELINGPLPKGLVVHHTDHNSMNDLPDNLQALTRSQHIIEHKVETHAWQYRHESEVMQNGQNYN